MSDSKVSLCLHSEFQASQSHKKEKKEKREVGRQGGEERGEEKEEKEKRNRTKQETRDGETAQRSRELDALLEEAVSIPRSQVSVIGKASSVACNALHWLLQAPHVCAAQTYTEAKDPYRFSFK